MYQIQTLNKISPAGLDILDRSRYTCSEEMASPDAVIVRSASMHDLDMPVSLRGIARAGAGVNNIPVERCSQDGIVVFNTPGANANAVKEMVIASLLLSARKIVPAAAWVQTLKGQGAEVTKLIEKGKSNFTGPELLGKKLGVIGLGAIGVMVANFAEHFGMEVYGYDPYLSVDAAWKLSSSVIHANSLKEIYSNCDFITVHVPLTPDTKEMINSESIQSMKHGVRILNFARGDLVNTEDLLAALDEKQVRCYITDFPTDEMLGHPGVIGFPHLAASTPESEDNCAYMAAKQLVDFLENGNITNSVNFPNVYMERSSEAVCRVAIIHRNVPNMISQITSAFAQEGANIENLTNKSKKEYAYTLADVCAKVGQDVVDRLMAIDGVIRVTVL